MRIGLAVGFLDGVLAFFLFFLFMNKEGGEEMTRETIHVGVKISLPVMVSYVALGLACGIVLFDAGFGLTGIALMSALVYAGAAQFLAASMVAMGASFPSIVLMVFFLGLRHILMSASISSFLKEKSLGFMALFGHTLSDESYGLNYSRFLEGNWSPDEAMVVGIANYVTWIVSTVIGGVIGSQLTINTVIMNYALIAMFICMMVQQFISKEHIIAGVASIGITVILMAVLKHNIALVISTLLASFFGYSLEVRKRNLGKGRENVE